MSRKIAVAIIHGIGKEEPDFADPMIALIKKYFTKEMRARGGEAPEDALVCKPVYWEPVMQGMEDELWKRVKMGGAIRWRKTRRFLIDYAADALAYQPTPWDRSLYDEVHKVFARTLTELTREAGDDAPLCVIAHSLGTVIASNYFYDLHAELVKGRAIMSASVKGMVGSSPLERGETLSHLYTLGSPIAVWAIRYGVENFGGPISVPSPALEQHFPKEKYPDFSGEWVNYYDADDVIGFPLKTLNAAYGQAVAADREVNVGGLLSFWNPASHLRYWTDADVVAPIGVALARAWRALQEN